MGQGQYIGLTRSEAAQGRPDGPGGGVDSPRPEIAPPGAFCASEPREVDLAEYAAARYPDLRRGMIITVERPWQLSKPGLSLLAWRIRARQADVLGLAPERVRVSHAMLYAGMGRCWSQDTEFGISSLASYRGCTLHFWDNPAWSRNDALRHRLMSDCGPHAGEKYAYGDIAGLWAWAISGHEYWLERLGDRAHWYCSEAVVNLVRQVEALAGRYFLPGVLENQAVPQLLHNQLAVRGWPCLALRIV